MCKLQKAEEGNWGTLLETGPKQEIISRRQESFKRKEQEDLEKKENLKKKKIGT